MDISPRRNSWFSGTGFPSDLFEYGSEEYELYEENGEFVLSLELPGYDPGEIRLPVVDEFLVGGTEIEVQS